MPQVEIPKTEGPQFTEKQLWYRYLDVTKELLKFINQEDIDMFLKLVEQRGKLIDMMKALPEHVFAKTEECNQLREQIKPMDMQIGYKARTWLNKSKRNNMAVHAYDISNFAPAGNVFNREF